MSITAAICITVVFMAVIIIGGLIWCVHGLLEQIEWHDTELLAVYRRLDEAKNLDRLRFIDRNFKPVYEDLGPRHYGRGKFVRYSAKLTKGEDECL